MSLTRETKMIVVIGAGVTGLTAAWELQRRGHRVLVLEKSERPGGAIRTTRADGYLVEGGPNTMLLTEVAQLRFFEELGLRDQLLDAVPTARNRYLVRHGVPVAAPMSFGQFLRSPLLSAGAKLRLLAEPLIRRAPADREESVAQFVARRLGASVVDAVIDPFVGGIYAGDPARLSVRHSFPTLHEFEQAHGSLVRGAIATRRARRRSGQPAFRRRSISFRQGMQAIIDALVHAVGESLFTATTIEQLTPGTPWRVRFTRADEPPVEVAADAVIVTTPAYATAGLPFTTEATRSAIAPLDGIEYPPVTSVALGFARKHVAHPLDGFGMLVPTRERMNILGTLFNSSLFPGRVPDGCVLLTTFVGGTRQPELAGRPADQLRTLVTEDLQKLLGVSGEPTFMHVTAWPRAIPQYNLGHARFLDAMTTAEQQTPGLFFGGHARDGVSVGDCIRAGWKLAERAG